MKATPSTIVNDSRRLRMVAQMPPPGFRFTFQILLSEFCSWAKRLVEPQIRVIKLRMPAALASLGWSAFCRMVARNCEPSLPMAPCSWVISWLWAACWPKKKPTITTTSTSRGAIETAV